MSHSTPYPRHSTPVATATVLKPRLAAPTQQFESKLECLGQMMRSFPPHSGIKVHMSKISSESLGAGIPGTYLPLVAEMLRLYNKELPEFVYVMIDEGEVTEGECHRRPGLHVDGYWDSEHDDYSDEEDLLIATNVLGSVGYIGKYSDHPGKGGCCAHIDVSDLHEQPLHPGIVWCGNVTMLHKCIPIAQGPKYRSIVRINIPKAKEKA